MQRKTFFILLTFITILGFSLRLVDYDRIPGWRESDDEIHYAWTGLTWITKGIPTSWSYLESYPTKEKYQAWGRSWLLVRPMLEKPPLYSLLSGTSVFVAHQSELAQVRLSTIRLLPLFLSIGTIFLTGVVGSLVFSPIIGLTGALLYGSVPTIVMANRLSVTENLLTPLSLLTILIILTAVKSKKWPTWQPILIGLISSLAFLTKQSGIAVVITGLTIFAWRKNWRAFFLTFSVAATIMLIFPLIGFVYNWHLFLNLTSEARRIGLSGGLPLLITTLVSRPVITTEKLFPDSTMLLGYLLFFTSPWWLLTNFPPLRIRGGQGALRNNHNSSFPSLILREGISFKKLIFLIFPFMYLIYLVLTITGAETIGSGQGFWGWYVYPLFPYVMMLLSYVLVDLWKKFDVLKTLVLILILGSGTIRFALSFFPREFHYRWQILLMGLIFCVFAAWKFKKQRSFILIVLFLLYIGVNIYTSIHLSQVYPPLSQP